MIDLPEGALEVVRLAVFLNKDIEVLDLGVRSYNCLRRFGIRTIADLCEAYFEGKLPKIRNLGQKSVYEIEFMLSKYLTDCGIGREGT